MTSCQNCQAARGDPLLLRYSIEVVNPDGSRGEMEFKVAKARAMVKYDPRLPRPILPRALRQFLEQHAEAINVDHLAHLPPEDRCEPGLIVQFDELDDRGQQVPTAVLIDGTHRAARALRDNRLFLAYVLTDAEMAACVEVHGTRHERMDGWSPDLSATPLGAGAARE